MTTHTVHLTLAIPSPLWTLLGSNGEAAQTALGLLGVWPHARHQDPVRWRLDAGQAAYVAEVDVAIDLEDLQP